MTLRKYLSERLYLLPIWIFPIALFAPILINSEALFWGTPALQFIPWHQLVIENLREGIFPLWNSMNGMGAPLAANYQSAVFYPPNWVVFLFGAWLDTGWLAWAHTLMIMLHLIWMGLGMTKLMKTLGFGEMSQVISGLSFSLCGYFVARNSFFSMIWAGSWLPWIIYAVSRIVYPGSTHVKKSARIIHFPLVLFTALQLFAGHAQLTWYTLLLAASWLLIGGWTANRWSGMWEAIVQAVPSLILSAGLCAIQLGLTTEYLFISQRSSSVDFETSMTYSLWIWRLVGFITPGLFGNPGLGNYWGYASFWEDALYIGLIPFFLALMSLQNVFSSSKNETMTSKNKMSRFLWVMVIVSVLLALGKNTPIFKFLYHYIPTFDMFNAPARYLIWAEFSLVVLAGIGFENWHRPQGKALYWTRLATMGGLAVTLGAFAGWYLLRDIAPSFVRAVAIAGLFSLATGILTLFHPQNTSLRYSLWKISLVLIIGVDLLIEGRNLLPSVDMSFYTSKIPHNGLTPFFTGRTYIHPDQEYFIKFKRFLTFSDYSISEEWRNFRYALIPNINILSGIYSANNFDPLVTERYFRWMEKVSDLPSDARQPWYNMMNVTAVETRQRHSHLSIRFEPVEGSNRFWIFPCAKSVKQPETAWGEVIKQMSQQTGSFEPGVLIVEGNGTENQSCEQVIHADVTVLLENSNYLTVKVTSDADGWLMLSDSWYPGWKATVDGNPARVYPANYAFKAVQIHKGENMIQFSYLPVLFIVGLCVSCFSILILFLLFNFSVRAERKLHSQRLI